MPNEIEGQPAASYVVEGSAFDIETQILRDIEWRPSQGWWEPPISRRNALCLLPQFSSETAAFRIPVRLWNKILGYLEYEPETLSATEKVCRAWYPTSHRLRQDLSFRHWFRSARDVRPKARYIKTVPKPRRYISFPSIQGEDKQRSLGHLGTFAAMFAGGHVPCLSMLNIEFGEWTPGAIPQSVFLHLSSFHSITLLRLTNITLPSITVLLRLVCAFDRLEELHIGGLRLLDRRVPPASRRWDPSPNLKKLTFGSLNWPDQVGTLAPHGTLEMSSGSETVLFLLNAFSCSDLNQLLHHAGKALRTFRIHLLTSLWDVNPHNIQPLHVPDVDLSRNVGLRELTIVIYELDCPPAFMRRAETHGVIQRMISSTCPTVLEKLRIEVLLNYPVVIPSIMSHVLLALRAEICPPGHPLTPEKYTSLKSVTLEVLGDETDKRKIEAEWANLAPTWFPSLYSRGIINIHFLWHETTDVSEEETTDIESL